MEKVDAWRTTDGKIWDDREAAQEWQCAVNLREELTAIVEAFHCHGLTAAEIVDELMNQQDALRAALSKRGNKKSDGCVRSLLR